MTASGAGLGVCLLAYRLFLVGWFAELRLAQRAQCGLSDAKKVALLCILAPIVLLPARRWPLACLAIGRLRTLRLPYRLPGVDTCLPASVLTQLGGEPGLIMRNAAAQNQEYLYVLSHHLGWRPGVRLIGSERLEEALARGRGAIIWVSQFGPHHLISKMALSQAGYRPYHLSAPGHPFSETAFGQRFLNPLATGVENRYLEGRVLLAPHDESPGGGGIGALRVMLRILARNHVVSITVANTALQIEPVAFFNGRLALPTAPVNLAIASGAALLPLFSIEKAPGVYEVHIEGPINSAMAEGRSTAISDTLSRYAALLEAYVQTFPCQWVGPFSFC